jgi:hypothetical protein
MVRPQMTIIQRMRFACRITTATDTHRMRNTYCFSTATMVSQLRLNVMITRILSPPFLTLFGRCMVIITLHIHQQMHTIYNILRETLI